MVHPVTISGVPKFRLRSIIKVRRVEKTISKLVLQNGLAKERVWKGIVEIDYVGMRLSEDMLAHPSAKISQKAYEFLKNINSELHFNLLPVSECYPRVFKDASPNRDDIALYFYPANIDRPKGIY